MGRALAFVLGNLAKSIIVFANSSSRLANIFEWRDGCLVFHLDIAHLHIMAFELPMLHLSINKWQQKI